MMGLALEQKFDELFEGRRDDMSLRLHRAISWIQRADYEMERHDMDAAFIFYWIAFNSAYAKDTGPQEITERVSYEEYFDKVVLCDTDDEIYKAIYDTFAHAIWGLMNNKFIYDQFWKHHSGVKGYDNWEDNFDAGRKEMNGAFHNRNSRAVLTIMFGRLYMLRNQLFHGSATWNSSTTRQQVEDAASIMEFMLPVFVRKMLDNPDEDWGKPFYPVLPDNVFSL